MQFHHFNTIKDLEEFLRNFKNSNDDEYVYDFNLVFRLFLALIDNLRKNSIEGDWEEISEILTQEEKEFILKLGKYANPTNNGI